MSPLLNNTEKKLLIDTARKTIEAKLKNTPAQYDKPTETLYNRFGSFVTLHVRDQLKGCIGHMLGIKPIFEEIKELAVASAFQDPRFPPLTIDELKFLNIEISILSPLQKIANTNEIIPGKHGVLLENGYNSGVFLPQVAIEQGWDRQQLLINLCYKAGLCKSALQDPSSVFYIFTAEVFNE